ncbi:hypothetical protein [Zobellia sp. 1_MG-2023]|uniref:hypothetical protein n=1 Tax=Zobellia sp. 1_MG-2023 TaxID=3062626 RepID=UPI0026E3A4C1|nr:hypothetical protein [Zobellia sp. 1_MG-2023]MDO6819620.1 hypothetical protein [Zobellia sp. 1_MG-2023]
MMERKSQFFEDESGVGAIGRTNKTLAFSKIEVNKTDRLSGQYILANSQVYHRPLRALSF